RTWSSGRSRTASRAPRSCRASRSRRTCSRASSASRRRPSGLPAIWRARTCCANAASPWRTRCRRARRRPRPPTARARSRRPAPPRETGGNMDVRQLVVGAKLWLPVDVPGALFSIGDLHFAQGDGEVCGTAIEVAGSVTVRFAVHAVPAPAFPAYETPGARRVERSFATVGIPVDVGMSIDAAARAALLEMIGHLERRYGFERPAAYALCSACVDLSISEVVDVPYPLVSALLPLDVFE